jgi:hypothetical protein
MSRWTAPDDYFRAVERTFLALRGGALFLTPADWDQVRRWEERGIPLEVVRSGIEAAFAGRVRVSPRMPLGACAREVEAALGRNRVQQAGAAGSRDEEARAETGAPRLVDSLRKWSPPRETLRDPDASGEVVAAVRDAAREVERLHEASAATAEALQAIEDALLAGLPAALAVPVRQQVEREVEARLAPYRTRMPESTWRKTFDQAVRRRAGRIVGLEPFTP